ncbi:hypothetical protein D3C83_116700 [compost metagenome]
MHQGPGPGAIQNRQTGPRRQAGIEIRVDPAEFKQILQIIQQGIGHMDAIRRLLDPQ